MPVYGPTESEYQQNQVRQSAQTGQLMQAAGDLALQNRQFEEQKRQFQTAQNYQIMKSQLPAYGNNVAAWAADNPETAKGLIDPLYGEGATERIYQEWRGGQWTPEAQQAFIQDLVIKGDAVYQDALQRLPRQQQGQGGGGGTPVDFPQGTHPNEGQQSRTVQSEETTPSPGMGFRERTTVTPGQPISQRRPQQASGRPAEGSGQGGGLYANVPEGIRIHRSTEGMQQMQRTGKETKTTTEATTPAAKAVEGFQQKFSNVMSRHGGDLSNEEADEALVDTAIGHFGARGSQEEKEFAKKNNLSAKQVTALRNQVINNMRNGRPAYYMPTEEEKKTKWWWTTGKPPGEMTDKELENYRSGNMTPINMEGEGSRQGARAPSRASNQVIQDMMPQVADVIGITDSESRVLQKTGEEKLTGKEEKQADRAFRKVQRWALKDESVRERVPEGIADRAIQLLNETQPQRGGPEANPLLYDMYHDQDAIDTALKQAELQQRAAGLQLDKAELAHKMDQAAMERMEAATDNAKTAYDMYWNILKDPLGKIAEKANNADDYQKKFEDLMARNKQLNRAWENLVDLQAKVTGLEPDYIRELNKRRGAEWIRGEGENVGGLSVPGKPATGGLGPNQGASGSGELSEARQFLQNHPEFQNAFNIR